MFVDFNKVFSQTPQTELKIPQALIDQLSSKLPDGFIYTVDTKTNNLTISHDGKMASSITVGGMTLKPTAKQREILGEEYSVNDILKLSYNSQQPVPVRFKNDKYITINGEDISIEHLSYNPLKPYEIDLDSTFIYPHPFPPAFNIKIGNDNTLMELSIIRVPNDSLENMAFESNGNKCLSIKYFLNPNNRSFSMKLNISIAKAITIQEIIDAIEIYDAFIEGKGYIFGELIPTKLASAHSSRYDDEALVFWKKIKKLEKKLGVSFDPHSSNFDFEEICYIEQIYQNIVNNVPIKTNVKIETITSKWDYCKDKTVADTLGQPLFFEFVGKSLIELLGQKIELPCIVGVFNAVLAKYEENDLTQQCTLFLENESTEKQMYTSTLYFLNQEELQKYKDETPNRFIIFRDAKKSLEYLIF